MEKKLDITEPLSSEHMSPLALRYTEVPLYAQTKKSKRKKNEKDTEHNLQKVICFLV